MPVKPKNSALGILHIHLKVTDFQVGLGFEEMAEYKLSEDPIWKKMYVANVYIAVPLIIHWHCRLQSVQCENFGGYIQFFIV